MNILQADETDRIVTRKEVALFSQRAFREAIVNAFVHNLWITGKAPMITAYSDRIEILSRGTLAPAQTIEGFYLGESVPANRCLPDILSDKEGDKSMDLNPTRREILGEMRNNSNIMHEQLMIIVGIGKTAI